MQMSPEITELAAAMARAQANMTDARRDAENPFLKAKYADLSSVRAACLAAMNAEGLSVFQFPRVTFQDTAGIFVVELETLVAHGSGQFIRDCLIVPVSKPDIQGVGSAISYARRYALSAIAGIAPAGDDDDGQTAKGASQTRELERPAEKPRPKGPPKADAPPAVLPDYVTTTVQVLGIVKRAATDGPTVYVISGDDHHTYLTTHADEAQIAKDAKAAGQAIQIGYRPTAAGKKIHVLRLAGSLAPEPPL
jgi:hypothetical protein